MFKHQCSIELGHPFDGKSKFRVINKLSKFRNAKFINFSISLKPKLAKNFFFDTLIKFLIRLNQWTISFSLSTLVH